MKTITIAGFEKTSHIHVGASLNHLPAYLPAARTIIISDENVVKYYGDRFPSREIITIGRIQRLDALTLANGNDFPGREPVAVIFNHIFV